MATDTAPTPTPAAALPFGACRLFVNASSAPVDDKHPVPHNGHPVQVHLGPYLRRSIELVPFTGRRCPEGSFVAIRCTPARAAQWVKMRMVTELKSTAVPEGQVLDLDTMEREARSYARR
jgi:hypothetical protein